MSSRRSANFTHHEKEILLSLMQTYRHVVEDKRTDGIMVKEKNAAWMELTDKYNAQNEVWTRSVKQLRQCWKNLKSRARIDLMRINPQTNASDSDPNSVRLSLVPINNSSKQPSDNSNRSSPNSLNNINNNTTGNIINNNNTLNNNNANNNNTPNIILSSILNNNNNNNINNSNSLKSGSGASYGSRLQALSATGSNSVVGLSPSLIGSGSLTNRANPKTIGSKKRKTKKVALNNVSSRNYTTNDSNSNSNSNSRRQARLLAVASATIGVERDDIDDEDEDDDDDDEENDTVAVLAADNDDDSNTIGARRRRRRRLNPTSKPSPVVGDSALVDVGVDENDEFDDDENEDEEEEEDDDIEGDDNDDVDDDDDDIDDSGTVDDDIYNDVDDVRRSSRQHHRVESFHVEQNSNPSSQGIAGQSSADVDPLYSVESLAVVSVSGSADRIHFQHHGNSPTSDLHSQADGNLLHSHHQHQQLHQSHHHQPPHLHSQVSNYQHSSRLPADSISRLDDDFTSAEPDIKVFDSIRGFGKVLHTPPSFPNQINNSVNFTSSINYNSDINDLNGVLAVPQPGPLIVSAQSDNGGDLSSVEPVLVEKVNDQDMLHDDLRKTEHVEKMKNIRLERRLISVEHKARMGLIKLKSDYIKMKMDYLLQNKR